MTDTHGASSRKMCGNRTTDDLVQTWQLNDRQTWSDDAFAAMQEELLSRGIQPPAQNPPVRPVQADPISPDRAKSMILSSVLSLLISGAVTLVLWFFQSADARADPRGLLPVMVLVPREQFHLSSSLSAMLYGPLIVGIALLAVGGLGWFYRRPTMLIVSGVCLLLAACWNFGSPFLTIPGYAGWGVDRTIDGVLANVSKPWLFLALLQTGWGFGEFGRYAKATRALGPGGDELRVSSQERT